MEQVCDWLGTATSCAELVAEAHTTFETVKQGRNASDPYSIGTHVQVGPPSLLRAE